MKVKSFVTALLLVRREMRQQILFEFTGQIRCCMAMQQSSSQHISDYMTNEIRQ